MYVCTCVLCVRSACGHLHVMTTFSFYLLRKLPVKEIVLDRALAGLEMDQSEVSVCVRVCVCACV